ncbi:MAG: hypothetical protein COW42_10355 [Deltaproteobacteria bacterium CG17_big_fil_post_rev_8_21_14_2_50_63_7]|nr:MAG: hypothetical protein COW42_10355 [Deltaproteobacteria bacterium CG17_big_fil_post_rev_8_21_14_2_50_63_7]
MSQVASGKIPLSGKYAGISTSATGSVRAKTRSAESRRLSSSGVASGGTMSQSSRRRCRALRSNRTKVIRKNTKS